VRIRAIWWINYLTFYTPLMHIFLEIFAGLKTLIVITTATATSSNTGGIVGQA